ncbi:MAG: GDP-mannose 4,6-dehydratase [Candidatus Pacebacteria bacterium]|nr:GDP-mannose 4,6-dehydratase [Candidatus Paceibacterota bacterium]
MKKYLVTGGAGFIGSSIAKAVGAEIFDITHNQNILNEPQVLEASKNVDGIFHCAAKISVPESFEKPEEYYSINVIGTKNILATNKKIVFSSSAAVYGVSTAPVKENSLLKPESPYGQNKVDAEKILSVGSHIALRYFNVYPSRSGVISKFIALAKEDKDIVLAGDGSQIRDFIFIDDIVVANIKAMEYANASFEVFNIASGVGTSIKELAKMIIRLTNSKSKITFKPAGKGDVPFSIADISKARQKLGWEPKVGLEEGLRKIIY